MNKRQAYFESDLKIRSTEDNEKTLEGYFIRFNEETEIVPGMLEEIAPEAVINSLNNNDIRCLFNHDTAIVLGRTGNKTLELKADDIGLYGRVKINPNDRTANDIYSRIERGDINGCSFGFHPIKEDVIRDEENDTTKFIVRDANILEVSCVTFPAYPQTEVKARSKQVEDIKQRELEAMKQEILERYE